MSHLITAVISGVKCIVDEAAPSTPVTNLGQDIGDVVAYNADVLRGIQAETGDLSRSRFISTLSLADSSASANAKVLFYSSSSSNWSGLGVDASGNFWLRTGLGTTYAMGFSNNGSLSFNRADIGLWTGIGDSSGAMTCFGGNMTINVADAFAYRKTSGSLGAVGVVMNRTLNVLEIVTSGTTAATAGNTFTPTQIAAFGYPGGVMKMSVFGATLAGQQTGGSATASGTYGAIEQTMLQKAYDCLRTFGFLN